MDAQREKELFGPTDPSVLTQQHMHRSRMVSINGEQSKNLLRAYQGGMGVFWTYRTDPNPRQVGLHPRVLDRLKVMGFYGPARCGSFRLDRHLITALVERWRPETHTFHFPIGETTITLQDIAIIWGLSIEGEPIICNEPKRTQTQWREYCQQLLGFLPQDWEMRNKSAILLTQLNAQVKNLAVIDNDTPQEVVDQYARGCALLLLACVMMPDITRNSVSLVYLYFLEDVNIAGEYSWGSAVLAYLYRELCMASHADRSSIAGPLSVLQIWAWSRIRTIQPSNVGEMLVEGRLMGAANRDLGLPPYGTRWIQYHDYTASVSHTIRPYRDIFDRLSDEQFIWEPYDMQLLEISTLGPRCLTENWMSESPLINIGIVEIHHPNRVLRQFGMIQNIPHHVETTHELLHADSRKGKTGFDWARRHAQWIEFWRTRQPFGPTMRINGDVTMTSDYMQWYNRITRRLISPDQYTAEIRGFQPPRTSAQDILVRCFSRLKISRRQATIDNRESIIALLDAIDHFISEVEPVLETPSYLVDSSAPQNKEAEQGTTRQRRKSFVGREDVGSSTSRVRRKHSSATQEESSYTQHDM